MQVGGRGVLQKQVGLFIPWSQNIYNNRHRQAIPYTTRQLSHSGMQSQIFPSLLFGFCSTMSLSILWQIFIALQMLSGPSIFSITWRFCPFKVFSGHSVTFFLMTPPSAWVHSSLRALFFSLGILSRYSRWKGGYSGLWVVLFRLVTNTDRVSTQFYLNPMAFGECGLFRIRHH